MKECTKCRLEKDESEFSKRAKLKSGLRSQCKSCDKAHNDDYKPANKDSIQAQRAIYRRDNRQKLREDSKNRKHERRAIIKSGGRMPPEDYFWKIQMNRCVICCEEMNRDLEWPDLDAATWEHIIPLKKGGPHHVDNVRLAHWGCNRNKNDRLYFKVINRLFISVSKFLNEGRLREYEDWKALNGIS